jgi:hypothetical protein
MKTTYKKSYKPIYTVRYYYNTLEETLQDERFYSLEVRFDIYSTYLQFRLLLL